MFSEKIVFRKYAHTHTHAHRGTVEVEFVEERGLGMVKNTILITTVDGNWNVRYIVLLDVPCER